MAKQTIIAISREFGSEGHEIARIIAEDLGLKLYDRSMLDEMADNMGIKVEVLEKHDEKPRNFFLTRTVGKYTNSMEEIVADMQFEFIKEKADSGESFVIVGRCADSVLRGMEGLITIFVIGTKEAKVKHVMEKFNMNESEALIKMARHDKKRSQYHNRHSDGKWGDSRFYDLCINSSLLGVQGTVKILEDYIHARMEK
ncbi:cytidylate kinase-like family protein [Roseburia sp. 1XD42-69]|uniref:cytidylate kinase-like family protein n=1 Tax=Roseburia sp. 1XD42-69 TaxID=2320088 RepID=UPI000EA21BE0|nr:cytidylate kinase-like family protein [Roseburia sp. 1XD42-69]RKJ65163.1 cytidylate kinase-like family protein [Roseburia sp. 1XD42-69]